MFLISNLFCLIYIMFTCLSRKQTKPIIRKKKIYESCKAINHRVQKRVNLKPKEEKIIQNEEIQKIQKKEISEPKIIIEKISEKQSVQQISIKQENKSNVLTVQNDIRQKFSVMSDGAQNINESLISQTRPALFNESTFGTTSFGLNLQLTQAELKKQIVEVVQNLTRRQTFLPKAIQTSFQGFKKVYSQSFFQQSQQKQEQKKNVYEYINLQFSKAVVQRKYQEAYNIFKQMNSNEKNQNDKFGFSPIYLSTLISIFEKDSKSLEFLKKILKDQNINLTKKSLRGSKPIQQAILFKNISVLTNIFRASYCYRIHQIKKCLKQFAQALIQLPDMQLQLYIKVGSFVPLVDKLTPDDTIKIYKLGNNLRIDYSLVGYSFLQSKRRNMSCVIQKLPNSQYTILIINHDKKCYTDLFDPFTNQQLVLIIQDLLSTQIKRTNPIINKTSIKLQHNIFNQTVKQYISTGVAIKHQLKVSYTSNTQKLQPKSKNAQIDLDFLKSWEKYEKHLHVNHIKKNKKQLSLGVWLSKQSPLHLDQLLQIMKFLSFAHEGGEIVYNFLNDQKIKNKLEGFPMKIQIPMSFTLYLDIKIANILLEAPKIQFEFTDKYIRQNRVDYQKTLLRKQKRAAIIKFYT